MGGGEQERMWEEEGARSRRGTSLSRDTVSYITLLSEAKRPCQEEESQMR